jgi:hypothetical protein
MFLIKNSINKIYLSRKREIPLFVRDDSSFFGHHGEGSRERATPALCYPPSLKKIACHSEPRFIGVRNLPLVL